jgi:hypothetical protein
MSPRQRPPPAADIVVGLVRRLVPDGSLRDVARYSLRAIDAGYGLSARLAVKLAGVDPY